MCVRVCACVCVLNRHVGSIVLSSMCDEHCEQWGKLKNVTIQGAGTIDGNGNSGWYLPPWRGDRPTLLGLLWIDGLEIRGLDNGEAHAV